MRVLHLDDSDADALIVRRLLRKSDLEVDLVHCRTREQAVGHVQNDAFDLVLVDDHLGLVRGGEALEALVAAGYAGPALMLSGVVREGAEESLLHHNCGAWLDKNRLTPEVLQDAIRKVT